MSAKYYDTAHPQWITVDDEGDLGIQIEDNPRVWLTLSNDDKRNLAIDILHSIYTVEVTP